ncbi:hypothetical protein HDF08_004374 [Edaphobacter lichenicola]|uniref:Uncharacterized protein n=1 Tax=Tunturiibacter lichenicola TaxID=2051959 RepID=A0A852VM62_9BACT|nr:hypothetical protein [Edaphobacter lichenicola]
MNVLKGKKQLFHYNHRKQTQRMDKGGCGYACSCAAHLDSPDIERSCARSARIHSPLYALDGALSVVGYLRS